MKKLIMVLAILFLASPVQAAEFNSNLKFGMTKNAEVSKLQEFLADQGLYTGPITGNFFSLTLKAVKAFQLRETIAPVSGYFGPLTRTRANTIVDLDLTDHVAEAALNNDVAPVVVPKTTDDVVVKLNDQISKQQEQINAIQAQNRLLEEQARQQQQLREIIAEQQGALNRIVENTTAAPAPVVQPAPAPTLLPALELWEIPETRRLRVYDPTATSVELYAPSDAIIALTFNGQIYSVPRQTGLFITNLVPGGTYTYTWTYRTDGREDSIIQGSITTKSL